LNAPPLPFASLQPATEVELTPEREQELLGILNNVTPQTSEAEIQRLRGMIQPGELERLQKKRRPSPVTFGQPQLEFQRLRDSINHLSQPGNYVSPDRQQQILNQAIQENNWMPMY
jgi:hypothetical protein